MSRVLTRSHYGTFEENLLRRPSNALARSLGFRESCRTRSTDQGEARPQSSRRKTQTVPPLTGGDCKERA